jgi:hypothetical protein
MAAPDRETPGALARSGDDVRQARAVYDEVYRGRDGHDGLQSSKPSRFL